MALGGSCAVPPGSLRHYASRTGAPLHDLALVADSSSGLLATVLAPDLLLVRTSSTPFGARLCGAHQLTFLHPLCYHLLPSHAQSLSVERAFRAVRRCEVAVLVLDATEGITQQDFRLAEYIVSPT